MNDYSELLALPTREKLSGICYAALQSWVTLHEGSTPDLFIVAFTGDEVLPCATAQPTPQHLRRVAAGLLDLADAMESDDAD